MQWLPGLGGVSNGICRVGALGELRGSAQGWQEMTPAVVAGVAFPAEATP